MADIVYNSVTFSGTPVAPGASPDYKLRWLSCPLGSSRREMVDKHFFGIDGTISIDGGATPRQWTMTGEIWGADAAAIAAAETALYALQDGECHTFVRWGTTITGVELLEFKPGAMKKGQYLYESITLTFREL